MTLIIAVDGPAASGKGTIAARLAQTYGLPHLDTGLLYRAVGAKVLADGGSLDDEAAATQAARGLDAAGLSDDPRLTTGEAGEAASRVASFAGVRAALLELQQAFAAQAGGAVLDGRDIGTVVFPNAEMKIFMTADPEVRARRRYDELLAKGDSVSLEEIRANIVARDKADMTRAISPLRQADDAVVLDNSHMTVEEQMTWFMERFDRIACGR